MKKKYKDDVKFVINETDEFDIVIRKAIASLNRSGRSTSSIQLRQMITRSCYNNGKIDKVKALKLVEEYTTKPYPNIQSSRGKSDELWIKMKIGREMLDIMIPSMYTDNVINACLYITSHYYNNIKMRGKFLIILEEIRNLMV